MKAIIVLLLFLASLLFAATAVMQGIMGHVILMAAAFVAALVLSVLAGAAAQAT